jgi:hypothetical protein
LHESKERTCHKNPAYIHFCRLNSEKPIGARQKKNKQVEKTLLETEIGAKKGIAREIAPGRVDRSFQIALANCFINGKSQWLLKGKEYEKLK